MVKIKNPAFRNVIKLSHDMQMHTILEQQGTALLVLVSSKESHACNYTAVGAGGGVDNNQTY